MPAKTKKIFIVGDSSFAEVAYEYFQFDSEYEVAAFVVEKEFIKKEHLFDLPIIAYEELKDNFDTEGYYFYVAIIYTQLNRLRKRFYLDLKNQGYKPASYISSQAFLWRNVQVGEHCFIFENNVIQPFCKIGDNVVLWSGNHIGHHSSIADHCFIASHAVISGHCQIGENTFIGVNATLIDSVNVAPDNLIGAGVLIKGSTSPGNIYKGTYAAPAKLSTYQYYSLEEKAV